MGLTIDGVIVFQDQDENELCFNHAVQAVMNNSGLEIRPIMEEVGWGCKICGEERELNERV